jgi:hypothetical protein
VNGVAVAVVAVLQVLPALALWCSRPPQLRSGQLAPVPRRGYRGRHRRTRKSVRMGGTYPLVDDEPSPALLPAQRERQWAPIDDLISRLAAVPVPARAPGAGQPQVHPG